MSAPHDPGRAATLGGLTAIALWSASIAVVRSLSEQVGPLTAAAGVYLVGSAFCWARRVWSGQAPRALWALPRRYLLGCGSLFVGYTAALYLAIGLASDRAQAIEIGLVNYLWPAGTVLLAVPLLGKRANAWLLPGTLLALAGIVLVMTQGAAISWSSFWAHAASNPLAYGLALVAAVTWALYSNLARRWSSAGSDGAIDLFMPATGLVLLALRFAASEPLALTARAVFEIALLGGLTALAYGLWDVAMRRGNLLLVAVSSYFTPLLSTLVSCAYLGVTPGPQLWVGCLVLIAGSLVSWRSIAEPATRVVS